MKKVLVLGASLKAHRYSNMAMKKLGSNHFWVIGVGLRQGRVEGIKIEKEPVHIEDLYAVTLYINADNQKRFYDYIIGLKPQKVVFNPGAENRELEILLDSHHIEYERACTLVLLSMNQF